MLAPTFADPALGPQAVFRTLLDALAQPGRIRALANALPAAPRPAEPALYATALALLDYETPVWLDPALAPLAEPLRFHTGAPIAAEPAGAAFALIGDAAALPPLPAFAQGTDAFPDRSTTLVVQVARLGAGDWRLRGPGIRDAVDLDAPPLGDGFVADWRRNHDRFPRGVDAFLVHGRSVVGLPRTTSIEG